MMRKIPVLTMLITVSLLLSWPEVCAAKPFKDVLPAATKFSWSVTNQQEFQDRLSTTELGKMLSDPALKPFLDDLPRQLSSEASDHPLGVLWIDLGVGSADLKDLSEGEVTWALVHANGGVPVRVLMVDVAGRKLTSLRQVSHCYERKANPLWQYNLFAMVHSYTREACQEIVSDVSREIGLMDYILLFSTKELKKTRVKYIV